MWPRPKMRETKSPVLAPHMLAAGTLGTAAGDWVAEETPLGLAYGSALLVAALFGIWFISDQYGKMTKPWYWLTIVAARTSSQD